METKTHPTMNCCYSLRDDNRICYSEVLYSEDKAIAVYQDDINEVSVFATAGSATKRYAEWFAKEMQNIYGEYPTIKFYDMKRRDKLFQIKDEDRSGDQYARFAINLGRFKKAIELGYIEKDSSQNASPTASEMLEFVLQNEDKGDFYFSGYLIYPPRNDFRATVDAIGVDIWHPSVLEPFKEFTRTADYGNSNGLQCFAWWD